MERHADGLERAADGSERHADGLENPADGLERLPDAIKTIADDLKPRPDGLKSLPDAVSTHFHPVGRPLQAIGTTLAGSFGCLCWEMTFQSSFKDIMESLVIESAAHAKQVSFSRMFASRSF